MNSAAPTAGHCGYSLIELLIAMTVVAILTGFAIPTWRSYLVKAHRVEAIAQLLQLANRQEHFLLQHNRYADSAEITLAPPQGLGMSNANPHYTFTLATAGLTFSATARNTGTQAADTTCHLLQIDSAGERRATNTAGVETTALCWRN